MSVGEISRWMIRMDDETKGRMATVIRNDACHKSKILGFFKYCSWSSHLKLGDLDQNRDESALKYQRGLSNTAPGISCPFAFQGGRSNHLPHKSPKIDVLSS